MYHLGVATYLSTHRNTGCTGVGVSVIGRVACTPVFVRDPREDTLAWKGRVQASCPRVRGIWTFCYV